MKFKFGIKLQLINGTPNALQFLHVTEKELEEFDNSPFLRAHTRDACNPTSTNSTASAAEHTS